MLKQIFFHCRNGVAFQKFKISKLVTREYTMSVYKRVSMQFEENVKCLKLELII